MLVLLVYIKVSKLNNNNNNLYTKKKISTEQEKYKNNCLLSFIDRQN